MHGGIELDGVGMRFRLHRERVTSLKEAVLGRFRHLRDADELWALRDVSFSVGPGESVGVVGHNGSGKSTLLRITAGVLRPTNGRVRVRGRVSPMIELGAGFDPDLTGRDNVFLNGALLGYSRREMAAKLEQIVEFSELADFIDVPVKNYSSGMYARLGFAIAADVEPDVLLVDEVLAVGDERFQQKCLERIRQVRRGGTSVLLVTHALDTVATMCDRAIVLHHGAVAFDGPPVPGVGRARELQGLPAGGAAAAG